MSRQALVLVAALAGCADSIHHDQPDAGALTDDAGSGSGSGSGSATPTCAAGSVCTTRSADATYTTLVDATSMTAWTYVDFETGAKVAATDPWDLRFQRFHISSNSGVTGAGGVEVAPVPEMTFAQVTAAPATGYLEDQADTDGDGIPDYVFDQGDGWYDYDVGTHVLSAKPNIYVVKTDGGSTIKLEIKKYYDDAGTSGWLTLHWGPLP